MSTSQLKAVIGIVILVSLILMSAPASASYIELPTTHKYAKSWRIMVGNEVQGVRRTMMESPKREVFRSTTRVLFTDVPETHENFDAIKYVTRYGMMHGFAGGEFRPDQVMTRGEFTHVVADAIFSEDFIEDCFENISYPYPPEYALLFADLPKEGEEAERICAALMAGVVHGYHDQTFKKDELINFAEASKIVTRTYDVSFLPYRGSGIEWFKKYAVALADQNGIPVSIEKFDSHVTRAQAAEMLYRADAGITNLPSKSYADLMVQILRGIVRGVLSLW